MKNKSHEEGCLCAKCREKHFYIEQGNDVKGFKYKYNEDIIIKDFKDFIDRNYKGHYNVDNNLECFDAWIALGEATSTFRNTAMKYLWRFKKKEESIPKDDLLKAMHYILMCLYNEYYKIEK
jgi:hypothetical protein